MFVSYDVNLSGVPDNILLIPGLATLAPIAWILRAELHTPPVDRVFLESLERIRRSLERLYPTIRWDGRVRPAAVADNNEKCGRGGQAIMFSGGVDSLASYVRHRHERLRLVSVWGADVGLGQSREWAEVAAANSQFARDRSVPVSLVKSNFRTFFNHHALQARFFPAFPNWYSAVQQGLGLVALTALLSQVHGLATIRIPSTHTVESVEPWGSHPSIDNEIRWAFTETVHDGYELNRQMKLGLLADYIRTEDRALSLRVCWGRARNCCRCPKCCLTMVGLALEGVDPNRHGFEFNAASLAFIRARLTAGRMTSTRLRASLWNEVQQRVATRRPCKLEGFDDFCTWLSSVSIAECRMRSESRSRRALAAVRRYVENHPEPAGRWLRKLSGHPFP
jgi:hypothetical protein